MVYNVQQTGRFTRCFWGSALFQSSLSSGSPARQTRWAAHVAIVAVILGGLVLAVSSGATLRVVDARSGAPILGVQLQDSQGQPFSTADGTFHLRIGLAPYDVGVSAPGYRSITTRISPMGERTVALDPLVARFRILDALADVPLTDATVEGAPHLSWSGAGELSIWPALGKPVQVSAPGFVGQEARVDEGAHTIRLAREPELVITPAHPGTPLHDVLVISGAGERVALVDGVAQRGALRGEPHWIMAPGHLRQSVAPGPTVRQVTLRPIAVRALYLSTYAVADATLRSNVERLLRETEANSLVIDVKGDRGRLTYLSTVPLAEAIGATSAPTYPMLPELVSSLRERGVYTIARIVIFKDDPLARNGHSAGLDLAVRDASTGGLWEDGEDLAWVDPFRHEAWEYNIALAEEAAQMGFDEIQFDYVRFPTDPRQGGSIGAAQFSKPLTAENRVNAIAELLRRTRPAVNRHGAYLGIDTFGYTPWDDGDLGIGQALEHLAPHVDYISPMIYPSTFNAGLPGLLNFPAVVADPYRTVHETVKRAVAKVEGRGAVIRPWLQYFDDYPWQTRRRYTATEIQAQIRGSDEAGGIGWMMWDPSNRFDRGGLGEKR